MEKFEFLRAGEVQHGIRKASMRLNAGSSAIQTVGLIINFTGAKRGYSIGERKIFYKLCTYRKINSTLKANRLNEHRVAE